MRSAKRGRRRAPSRSEGARPRPITWRTLDRQVRRACDRADLRGVVVHPWTEREEREAAARDHAYVYPETLEFHFSAKVLALPAEHREAIVAHEVGHCLAQRHWGSSTEDEADAAAEQWLGAKICYDHAWPGKGLQVTCAQARATNPESGWEVVCPDGRVRGYPYHNKGDAIDDARQRTREQCRLWPKPSPIETSQPPCPEGKHTVRPIRFECRTKAARRLKNPPREWQDQIWYHGTASSEPPIGQIYLTPSLALARFHARVQDGFVHEYRLEPFAVWLDVSRPPEGFSIFTSMDSLGYQPEQIRRLAKRGQVIWDSADYRGHEQIFVLDPDVLRPVLEGNPATLVPAGRRTDPPSDLADYVMKSDLHKKYRATYFQGDTKVASSRTTPAPMSIPIGTWRYDDTWAGAYGHEIDELVEIDPRALELSEFLEDRFREGLKLSGKLEDAERYAQWLREGKDMPPVTVVETVYGTLKLIDGHRRTAAADLAGVPVRAWVSWLVPHPEGIVDSMGDPITVALTYELATGRQPNPAREQRLGRRIRSGTG